MKKIVPIGDGHCGHVAGLTPPKWQMREGLLAKMQKEMWNEYTRIVKKTGKIDYLICNGDWIDGKGTKSGGTELITNDLFEQVEMAYDCLKIWNTKSIIFTYGTPYHSSPHGEDLELLLANKFNAPIKSQINLQAEGIVFNIKHDVATSTIPWSRATAVGRERIQSMLWGEHDTLPTANVVCRSHVHHYSFQGGFAAKPWVAMTLPALQMAHTKYGARRCSAPTNWGIVVFEVNKDTFNWETNIVNLKTEARELIKIK